MIGKVKRFRFGRMPPPPPRAPGPREWLASPGAPPYAGQARIAERVPMTERRLISSGSRFEEQIGYSRAVVDGDHVWVSGTTGFDYRTMTLREGVVAQATQCFENIAAALAEAGASLDDVVRVLFIVPHRADWEPCWPVVKRYLGRAKPASTLIHAGLQTDAMRIEIEVTARLPTGTAAR